MGQGGLERAKWRGGGSHPRGLGEGQHGTLATRANVTKAAKEMRTPTSSWKMFPLLKIKFKSSELTSIFKSEIVFSTNQINEGINSLFVFYLLQIIRKCVKPSTKQVLQSSVRKNVVLSRGYQRKKYTQGLF